MQVFQTKMIFGWEMNNIKRWNDQKKHAYKDWTLFSTFRQDKCISSVKQLSAKNWDVGTTQQKKKKIALKISRIVVLSCRIKAGRRQSTSDHVAIRKLQLIWTAEVTLRSGTQRQPLKGFAAIVGKEINISICLWNLFPQEEQANGFIMTLAVSWPLLKQITSIHPQTITENLVDVHKIH